MIKLLHKLKAWTRRDDGNATIEFVIWFPFVIAVFSSGFEASLISTRQVMLNGAVDRTVRELRLGDLGTPSHAQLKSLICNRAGVIPNCGEALHIELERVSTDNWYFRQGAVECIDLDDADAEPALNFTPGSSNDLMLITVCASFRPIVPLTGLALHLPKIQGGNHYGIVSFSAFVVEPV